MQTDHLDIIGNHVTAATATLAQARRDGANVPQALEETMLGLARAWDRLEAEESPVVAPVARQMLAAIGAVRDLVPINGPEDEFSKIARTLDRRGARPVR